MVYVNITEFIAELKINWINTLYVRGKKNYTRIIGDTKSKLSVHYKIIFVLKQGDQRDLQQRTIKDLVKN